MPTDYTVNAYFLGNLDDDAGKEGSSATTAVITFTDVDNDGKIAEGEDLLDGDVIENLNDQSTLVLENAGTVTGWYVEIELNNGSKDVYFVPTDGTVPEDDTLDEDVDLGGNQAGDVEDLDPIVPCFTKGALIQTKRGEVPVELIATGDMVVTRDSGFQPVQWVGQREVSASELATFRKLQPILIPKGSLGENTPDRDLTVSPNHRILVRSKAAQFHFSESEVFVAAKHLLGHRGIRTKRAYNLCYVHFMFSEHQVVWSDGAWTESFCPGPQILKGFRREQRDELFELFPEIPNQIGAPIYGLARPEVKKAQVALLQL